MLVFSKRHNQISLDITNPNCIKAKHQAEITAAPEHDLILWNRRLAGG